MTVEEKIKALSDLAQKQGHITYDDFNDAFSDKSPEEIDDIYVRLRKLEIEIVDSNKFPSHN